MLKQGDVFILPDGAVVKVEIGGRPFSRRIWGTDEDRRYEVTAIVPGFLTNIPIVIARGGPPGDHVKVAFHLTGDFASIQPEGVTSMVFPVHNSISVTICTDAEDAIAQGFNYAEKGKVKPIEVKKVVVVRAGTQAGLPTVDFLLEDDTGQQFAFMLTGRLLRSIPCGE